MNRLPQKRVVHKGKYLRSRLSAVHNSERVSVCDLISVRLCVSNSITSRPHAAKSDEPSGDISMDDTPAGVDSLAT